MLFESKKELDNIMGRFSNDADGLRAKKEENKVEEEEFMKTFHALKEKVIWPSIVEIGNQLTEYKNDFHVDEEDEYVDAIAQFHPARITLNIYPASVDKAFYKQESTPYISFIANRYARKIGIMVSTMMPNEGGAVGSHGEYDLGKVTPEFVEKEIIEVLKNCLFLHDQK